MEIVYWAVNVIYSFHYFHHFICIEFILTTRSSKCWKNARVIVMAQWNGSWIWHNIFLINCIWRGVALSRPSEQDKISFAGKCRIQGVNNQLAVTTGGDLNDNNPTGPLLNHAPLSMTGIFPPKSSSSSRMMTSSRGLIFAATLYISPCPVSAQPGE